MKKACTEWGGEYDENENKCSFSSKTFPEALRNKQALDKALRKNQALRKVLRNKKRTTPYKVATKLIKRGERDLKKTERRVKKVRAEMRRGFFKNTLCKFFKDK